MKRCEVIDLFEFKKQKELKKYKTHTLLCATVFPKDNKNENYKIKIKKNS